MAGKKKRKGGGGCGGAEGKSGGSSKKKAQAEEQQAPSAPNLHWMGMSMGALRREPRFVALPPEASLQGAHGPEAAR